MNEHHALLAAVCANPEDDLPRLVYADWCEENGQPERAELIRVQCAFERHPERDAALDLAENVRRRGPEVPPDRRFAAELYLRSLRLMPRCPYWNQCDELVWVRGFIDRLACHPHVWFGGACVVCHGTGRVSGAIGPPDCMQCGGKGHFNPGLGPAVMRGHPVQRVELPAAVRRPVQFAGTSFAFLPGNTVHHTEIGPLAAFLPIPATMDGEYRFPTFDEALTALSGAAIAWARFVRG